MTLPTDMPLLSVAVTGLLVGSFLNVVCHRLPIMIRDDDSGVGQGTGPDAGRPRFDLMWPPSHCPACRRPIRAVENIPIVSFLLQRGRCAGCGVPIGWRYPAMELLAAILPVLVGMRWGTPLAVWAAAVFVWFLLALAAIDLRHRLLPDALTLPLLWCGLVLAALASPFVTAADAVLGAAVGYGGLWLIGRVAEWALRKPALGAGDAKLMAALGAWLGWQPLPSLLLLAAMLGLAVSLPLLATGRLVKGAAVPFGPFLAAIGALFLALGQFGPVRWPGL